MGWKISAIIINSDRQIPEKELLKALGYTNLEKISEQPFEVAMHPEGGLVYIGKYKGNTLICEQEFPMTFLETSVSSREEILVKYFPETEICALLLHSVVNFWGYSIIKGGEKIRVRGGSSETGTMVDFGEILEEEKELFSKSKLDESGNKVYFFEEFGDEEFSEDQVGENFVFSLAKRYIGEELDGAENLLFETYMNGFAYK